MLAAAHKPGAIPLRPLGLGDMYDAAFKIIRFNPRATVGSSVIVTGVAMLVPILVSGALTLTIGLSMTALDDPNVEVAEATGLVGAYASLGLGFLLQWIGMLMVTGMNAHVALAAATGRRLGMGEAWALTRGKRWRLFGLTLMSIFGATLVMGLVVLAIVLLASALSTGSAIATGILVGLVGLCAVVWLWVRIIYLAVPPLMLEPIGVFKAYGRAFRLTRKQFWRTFGIGLLSAIIAGIAGQMLATPANFAGAALLEADPGGAGAFWYIVATAVGSVMAAAIVSPFITTVTSLQYLDQRIRKEAFDLELMARAGIIPS